MSKGLAIDTYDHIVEHMYEVTKAVFDKLSKKAIEEEKTENMKCERPLDELKLSGDRGKRGFTSLFGVMTLGYYCGKIIDLVVSSAYCQACVYWKDKEGIEEYTERYKEYEDQCSANHSGSSGKIEVDAMKTMFSKSEEKFQVKYTNYGDSDSKIYKAILDLKPYGDHVIIVKSESVGHVEKRMGTRLRNAKKTQKLGNKRKLTDVLIKKLTSTMDWQ